MVNYVIRLIIASLVGYVVGIICNREINTKSKRVYALISMGAALLSITGTGMMQGMNLPMIGDPGRLPAQVVSALGFLVTGMIWITDDRQVMGITHAASLWLTAIIGMMIGLGLSEPTALGVIFFVIIFWFSNWLGKYDLRRVLKRQKPGDKSPGV
jgi:putative Mg2+ transporter-C (MgtC) family protein